MRFYEFADAEAQLGLLRTIIDNTWSAIAQQAEEQKKAEAERKAKARVAKGSKKGAKKAGPRMPSISLPPPQPLKDPPTSQPPQASNKVPHNGVASATAATLSNQKSAPNASTTPTPQQGSINAQIGSKSFATKNLQNQPKSKVFGKYIGTTEKDDEADDRHSKNGIAAPKKLPRNF
ncbi:MAG: hypothetical protein EWV88_06840 [Microcystis wesenbergii Mw_MB_S_20031200_S109D]|uniref:Uncharacterized protein n=1 Tax=Microcystis wesenbergii Mw_MB_S_20031200_S109D TaxID=2486241 RepID=A0A552M0W9_9CHRO|nr:MAG: hypothetical protein EWV88_06840 [Microcystis wesenbergii Mw_MB_S_20031200_S109D]